MYMNLRSADIAQYDRSVTVRSQLKKTGLQEFLELPGITEVRVNQSGIIITES